MTHRDLLCRVIGILHWSAAALDDFDPSAVDPFAPSPTAGCCGAGGFDEVAPEESYGFDEAWSSKPAAYVKTR